jgi:sn-glycerol 3-phosphate transport system ATP-binding protein
MAGVRFERVSKTYPNGQRALDGVDLEAADGELLVLVGPSGCGKSTALRVLAGLEAPTSGRVWIGGRDVSELPPGERDVAMVFQSYALYPHKSVRENLAFGLRMRGVPRRERAQRIEGVARRLGLSELLERRPAQLSGGERQRVALGRALVREPLAFLLDEPLSNLDARLRVEMRRVVARLHGELRATMLYVTHDQEEAMTLGDRIAVLRAGRVEQVAPARELWQRPQTPFVAEFIGSPAINWFDARVEAGALCCAALGLRRPLRAPAPDGPLRLGLRPQELSLAAPEAAPAARVELVESLGAARIVHALLEGPEPLRVALLDAGEAPLARGERIGVSLAGARLHAFDAESGRRREDAAAAAGDRP